MAVRLTQRSRLLYQLRLQVIAVLFCSLIPYVVRHWLPLEEGSGRILLMSFAGGMLASAIGLFLLRNMNAYPGVEASAYIVPSFSLSFAVILAVFFFLRLDYSRSLFAATFLLCVVLFYVIYFSTQRRARFVVAVVPGGDTERLLEVKRIEWLTLSDPGAQSLDASAVAVDLRVDFDDAWERRLADFALAGIPVYHSKHLRESLTGRVELETLSENSFGSLSPVSAYMTLKHAVDWLAAIAALIMLLPLLALVAIAVVLDSRGAPLFFQRRVGYRGQPFIVWKFRTMRKVAMGEGDARAAAMTGNDDLRITRLGRFLRKSRIDELPQLINVLKGEMSWIGPRPEAEVLSQWYEAEIPFYRYRHIVRPGITGWAQVCQGHVAEVADVRDKLYYDFYYIKNFSPWIDLLIVARTLRTMLTGFGAR